MKINDEVIYKNDTHMITDISSNICTLMNGLGTTVALLNRVYPHVPIDNFDITPFKNNNFYYKGSNYNFKMVDDRSHLGFLIINNGAFGGYKTYLNDPDLEIPGLTFKKNDVVMISYFHDCTIDNYNKLSGIRSNNIGNLNIGPDFRKDASLYMHRNIGKVIKTTHNDLVLIKFQDNTELYYPSILLKLISTSKPKIKTFNPTDKYLCLKTGKIVHIIENVIVTSIAFAKVKVTDTDEHMIVKLKDLKQIKNEK